MSFENSESVKQFWSRFIDDNPILAHLKNNQIDSWKFGGTPEGSDNLLSLVLEGKKTATCSLLRVYNDCQDKIPKAGTYSIILNSLGHPKCIVYLTETFVRRFNEIDERHAFEEGEGDRSLGHWRRVHKEFFSKYGEFDEDEYLLCERFKVIKFHSS